MKVIEYLTQLAHEAHKQPQGSSEHDKLYHKSKELLPCDDGFMQGCHVIPTKTETTAAAIVNTSNNAEL